MCASEFVTHCACSANTKRMGPSQKNAAHPKGAPQKTEPVGVTAQVIDVVTENGMYVVSVRFSGQVRENGVLNPLNEVWHLEKPVSGSSGWRVSGIQQVS